MLPSKLSSFYSDNILWVFALDIRPVLSVRWIMGGLKLEVEVDYNGWVSAGVHNAILDQNIDCANLNPEPSAYSGSWVHKGLGAQYPQSTLEYNLATAIEVWLLTQPVTCGMVSVVFVAMSRLKVASTTSASLPIIPSTERTNGKKICWSYQAFPCLSLLVISFWYNNLYIPSSFQVSASASPNLTPMITSVWFFRKARIDTSPCVSGSLPLWINSSSDLLRPKWIRVLPHMQWGEKSFLARWMISSSISFWCAMPRSPFGHLSAWHTKKVCMQP